MLQPSESLRLLFEPAAPGRRSRAPGMNDFERDDTARAVLLRLIAPAPIPPRPRSRIGRKRPYRRSAGDAAASDHMAAATDATEWLRDGTERQSKRKRDSTSSRRGAGV